MKYGFLRLYSPTENFFSNIFDIINIIQKWPIDDEKYN